MEFLQLKYFMHAAKTENFSHTAEFFKVPPSTVSITIKKLETELGSVLFNRNSNKLSLNENGKVFLKSIEKIFDELEYAKNNLLDLSGQPTGKIRMLVMTNRRIITKIISDFRREYPNVSFILDLDEKKDYKKYDIIITDSIIENGDFIQNNFLSEEIKVAVHSQNPLSAYDKVDMNVLKNEKFICLTPYHSLRRITDTLCEQAGFSPDIVIECDDPFYVREYVKMGMGISLVPIFSWQNQFDSSISFIKINTGVFRHSKIYTNTHTSSSAKFFSKYILKKINDL